MKDIRSSRRVGRVGTGGWREETEPHLALSLFSRGSVAPHPIGAS